MPWARRFLHHIQDSTIMKTLIVLCSLVTITVAVPTLSRGNFENVIEDLPEKIIREKKSPLHDGHQELIVDDGKEISQKRNSQKTETSFLEKPKVGFSKPIIIKKKLGYHVYRDSDEEMAHSDPNENCRKQFKVKLCDNEPSLHPNSNNVKTSERPHENISHKEMEKSIKMARDAVEKLQKDLLKMEQNTGKLSNSKENLESDMALQQDVEMAKNALEHIQKNIDNFESIDFQSNDPKVEESQTPKSSDAKAITEWKESIENIYKNVEIPRNMEDAFKFEKQNVIKSDNHNEPKMRENQKLDDQLKDQISTQSMKAVSEDNNTELNLKSKDEQNTSAENDMFVSPTVHTESTMKLHSDSLKSDNIFDKNLAGHDTKPTNEHLMTAKSDINSLMLTAKNTENTEIGNDSHIESSVSNDECEDEHHTHKSSVKTNEVNNEKTETESLMSKNLSPEQKSDSFTSEREFAKAKQTLSESLDVSGTEQKSVEHINHRFSDDDNKYTSDVKISLLKAAEMKDSHSQSDTKFHDKDDLTETFNARVPHEQLENIQQSLPSIPVGNRNAEHKFNEFSRMRMTENQNIDHLLNENHETQDFTLKHLSQEREANDQLLQVSKSVSQLQNTQLPTMNIEEHLNEHNNFHEPRFMKLAEEKHFNENIPQHLKTFSESNNEHNINLSTKTNEFRNQHMTNEHMKARMQQIPNMEQQLRENHRLEDSISSSKHHNDHLSEQFKSESEFHNDHILPPFSKTNGLRNGQADLNRHTSMRQNLGHELSDTQHLNDPFMLRWAQEKLHKDLQEFKESSEFKNGHKFPTMMKTNMIHNGHHKEPMHMRTTEDANLGQSFIDSHEFHDSHLMHWAQEKQQNDNLGQTFDGATELHHEPHMSEHLLAHLPTNRFSDHFEDNSHDVFPMRPRMHEHLHMMKHAKPYDMDSSMQPSMHIGMRDSNMPLGHHHHHHHHGLARSSYSPSLPMANSSPGTVGVFSETNTGCGIPLLLSCSPSVVSGTLAKAQPTGVSSPAYRSGDELMYYMKRDTNDIEGLKNVKVHKSSKAFNP